MSSSKVNPSTFNCIVSAIIIALTMGTIVPNATNMLYQNFSYYQIDTTHHLYTTVASETEDSGDC